VEEVTEEDDFLRARPDDRAVHARDVVLRRAAGQRNAGVAEARRLAEVEIGDEQRAPRRPERRTLGKEHEILRPRRCT